VNRNGTGLATMVKGYGISEGQLRKGTHKTLIAVSRRHCSNNSCKSEHPQELILHLKPSWRRCRLFVASQRSCTPEVSRDRRSFPLPHGGPSMLRTCSNSLNILRCQSGLLRLTRRSCDRKFIPERRRGASSTPPASATLESQEARRG